MKKERNNQQV